METKWLDDFVSLAETRSFSRSRSCGTHLEPIYETDIAEGLEAMALEGHGLAFSPDSSVRNEVEAGKLVAAAPPGALRLTIEVRIDRERPETARHVEPAVQTLWDFLGAAGQR